MNREERGVEINLLQIVEKLLEKAKYIILVTVIFGILGYFGTTMFMTPVYQASVKMLVNARKDEMGNITNDQLNSARKLVETSVVIIRGRDVLSQVISELNLEENYEQLVGAISVMSVNDTPVMQINVKHTNRETALQIAAKLLEIVPDILVETAAAGSVKPVEQAYAASNPVSPSALKNTVLFAFIGLAIACLAVFALMLLDNTYATDLEIQSDLDLPVLGVIPTVESCEGRLKHTKVKKEEVAK